MKKVTLTILANDILETNYLNSSDCAITRALKRAGLNYEDSGIGITHVGSNEEVSIDNSQYKNLVDKVLGMYFTKYKVGFPNASNVKPLPIEDFTFELTFFDLIDIEICAN